MPRLSCSSGASDHTDLAILGHGPVREVSQICQTAFLSPRGRSTDRLLVCCIGVTECCFGSPVARVPRITPIWQFWNTGRSTEYPKTADLHHSATPRTHHRPPFGQWYRCYRMLLRLSCSSGTSDHTDLAILGHRAVHRVSQNCRSSSFGHTADAPPTAFWYVVSVLQNAGSPLLQLRCLGSHRFGKFGTQTGPRSVSKLPNCIPARPADAPPTAFWYVVSVLQNARSALL